ncbi:transcription factor MYB124-like isoform X2 [Prosopis cineraria]|uniref:transcription factor MYB124-like isoform X2 n=1 Tax=Prosopis cineraria TaxID=364024 RepID=UPI0024105E1D|nr:transcription factor MYB124-like isoform X2 [Prosopis cineraria]
MQDMKQRQHQQDKEESKKKERHIVSWTQEEDDILREQISIHGTDNWTIIASKFKDKTTRQCRRRWYTYLNSDFKKGGWSPEEDMLLCEAQKIFGNRWTEIAKVVSGRTDNAVKNRFSTLCKKRAKYEALTKENSPSFINSNNKRIIFQHIYSTDATSEAAESIKKMSRAHIPDAAASITYGDRSRKLFGTPVSQQPRVPFGILSNFNDNSLPDQRPVCNVKFSSYAQNNKTQGTFLKKDDPKISVLMQQAELLSSLAVKVNTENMDQSLENAWKVLQDFLNRTNKSDLSRYKITDLQLENLKNMAEDIKSGHEGSQPYPRQPELHEDSPSSSEYSTGSTILPRSTCDDLEHSLHLNVRTEGKPTASEEKKGVISCGKQVFAASTADQDILPSCEEQIVDDFIVSALSSAEFSSPIQVTPLFRSLAAGIPSPQFSESERNFLMKTLGMESPSQKQSAKASQPPPCKRALLQSL